MANPDQSESASCFITTKWTTVIQVIQQGDGAAADQALEQFCQQYQGAIYAFIRRRGYSHERAQDLVQDFLKSRIVEKWGERDSFVHRARRGEGKFRAFLSHVLIRFLQDKSRAERTITAGGKAEHVSAELLAESGHLLPGTTETDGGREFDLEFARTLLELATKSLKHADHHLAVLMGNKTQAEVAQELGISDGAFRVSHLRFRQRLGEAIRQEVQNTVGDNEAEVNEEIRYLMSLFEHAM
jgi:RNA polymerase sigma factor (sigma-70 family)